MGGVPVSQVFFFLFLFSFSFFFFCQMKQIKNTVIFTGASKMLHSNLQIHLTKGCLMLRGKTFGGWAHFSYFDKRFGVWLRQTTDPLTKKTDPNTASRRICRYTARLASRAWAKRSLYDAEDCKFPINLHTFQAPLNLFFTTWHEVPLKQASTWSWWWSWVLPPRRARSHYCSECWSRFSSRAACTQARPAGYVMTRLKSTTCDCNKIAGRLEPRRPPMKDEGTETAFRLDQCKHFRKSKHLLRSEVNRCDQSSIELHLLRSTSTSYWWVDGSTCLASRISTQKESFPGSKFKPASIWTCWMLIDRQMQLAFMPELHRWISKLTAHLHHQDIFWSPW